MLLVNGEPLDSERVEEPTHQSQRVGHGVPGVLVCPVLSVNNIRLDRANLRYPSLSFN